MSDQEPRPQAPRRKKLVLRRIAANGSSPAEAWSNSYTGPLPPVRPPPNRQTAGPGADGPDDAAPEIISEQKFERMERIDHSERARMPAAPPPEAWGAAAMTPPAPRSTEVATSLAACPPTDRALPGPALPYLRATGDATAGASRISVPPTVASLPAPAAIAPHLDFGRARFSIDSKVLVGGGALAASMLLVAFGVFLGVHSTRPATSSTSETSKTVPETVVIDAKGAASPVRAPEGVVDRPPNAASEPSEQRAMDSTRNRVEVVDPTMTVDVSQLPPVVANAGRTPLVSTPKSPKPSTGWSVATGSAARPFEAPNEASNAVNPPTPSPGATAADAPSTGASASAVPEVPRSPAIAVDPLVQAVREDIREDEARTATSPSK